MCYRCMQNWTSSSAAPDATAGGGGFTASGQAAKSGLTADGILHGTRWTSGLITFSFPEGMSDYQPGYGRHIDDDRDGVTLDREAFRPATSAQQAVVRWALESGGGHSVEGFTNLDIAFAGPGGEGTIRIANSADARTAYVADFPGSSELPGQPMYAGDIWIGREARARPETGNYEFHTILHELGHALGLKHPHNDGATRFYDATLPRMLNSIEHSVMSYNSYPGGSDRGYSGAGFFPQTFMMADIHALQHLYGADYGARARDSRYSWDAEGNAFVNGRRVLDSPQGHLFQTIWDGGGIDTYDASNFGGGVRIDLNPGAHSTLSSDQLAFLGGPAAARARGNVYNAWMWGDDTRSLIENAVGGAGRDTLTGNQADNMLWGGAGRDMLYGGRGNDTLHGGRGADTLHGQAGDDRLIGGRGRDLLVGGPGADVFEFNSVADSPAAAPDVIRGFSGVGARGGDVIDLSGLAASIGLATLAAGSSAFGGMRVIALGDASELRVFADERPGRDFAVRIEHGDGPAARYTADDFFGVA